MEENIKIRERIIKCAKEKDITQKELLIKAGLNSQFLQDMKRYKILAENIKKIANVLDVSVDYLLGRTDNQESHKL